MLTAGEVIDLMKRAADDKLIDTPFTELLTKFDKSTDLQKELFLENYLLGSPSGEDLLRRKKLITNAYEKNNSHSYLESVIRAGLREHYKLDPNVVKIEYKFGKNKDFEECIVSFEEKELFRAAKVYGFRNIQIIQNSIKKGNCKYLYLEVMACPSGCVNGGKFYLEKSDL